MCFYVQIELRVYVVKDRMGSKFYLCNISSSEEIDLNVVYNIKSKYSWISHQVVLACLIQKVQQSILHSSDVT